jgi:hypothetical protein
MAWERFIQSRPEKKYRRTLTSSFRRLHVLAGLQANDAKEDHVTIRPTVAKRRRKRWTDLPPNVRRTPIMNEIDRDLILAPADWWKC